MGLTKGIDAAWKKVLEGDKPAEEEMTQKELPLPDPVAEEPVTYTPLGMYVDAKEQSLGGFLHDALSAADLQPIPVDQIQKSNWDPDTEVYLGEQPNPKKVNPPKFAGPIYGEVVADMEKASKGAAPATNKMSDSDVQAVLDKFAGSHQGGVLKGIAKELHEAGHEQAMPEPTSKLIREAVRYPDNTPPMQMLGGGYSHQLAGTHIAAITVSCPCGCGACRYLPIHPHSRANTLWKILQEQPMTLDNPIHIGKHYYPFTLVDGEWSRLA